MRIAPQQYRVHRPPGGAYLDRIVAAFGIDRDRVLPHQWDEGGAAEQGGPGLAFGEDACRN
jgi:hypothetical protein